MAMITPALALHGGCGSPAPEALGVAEWEALQRDLAAALRAGHAVLRAGGAALDAVEAAVVVLEDSPHFNAGHGAALCEDGTHELDASIMNGANLAAGAACTVRRTRNPVRLARAVMERSGCVLLAGDAADAFAQRVGLECVPNRYFTTPRRVQALEKLKALGRRGGIARASEADRHGTVGAVALDAHGHLAAATSTGGYNNKPVGRVGDSPIVGAGTYARDGVCAVSCTGMGEVFIRHVVGHELAARMRHGGATLEEASRALMEEELAGEDVGMGWVALDAAGRLVAPFNTMGMARGWVDAEGRGWIGVHREMSCLGRL